MRGLRCKRGLATTVSWAGTGSGPRRPLAPPVRAFIWVQLRERREREREKDRAWPPGLLLNQHSCLPAAATATSTTLYASFRHTPLTHKNTFVVPLHHSKYAILSISSRFFHLTSAFPLCFSCVLAVFHILHRTCVMLWQDYFTLYRILSRFFRIMICFFALYSSDI